MARFTPDSGEIIWIEFDPQAGREQAGRRPALVISEAAYNARTGLAVCCPITRTIRNHPFEVLVDIDGIPSAILSDHLKSIDIEARYAKRLSRVDFQTLAEVKAKVKALIGL
jgi:mRNA interferase MazF